MSFPHDFTWEVLDELPASVDVRHYVRQGQGAGHDGVVVRIRSKIGSWVGMFAFGQFGADGITCTTSSPDPTMLCVVARGGGYLVNTCAPDEWELVNAQPVMDCRSVPLAGLLVFADHTDLVAYGAGGLRWRTKRLAWNGLTIVSVGEQAIVGEYWDIRDDAMRRFEVDLATGAATGGVET
jgi:hypothetical protein